jgi:hypothetical protein
VQQIVGLEGDAFLTTRFLDEDVRLEVMIEAQGESSIHAQLGEVVALDRLGSAATGAAFELSDAATAGTLSGFVHCGTPWMNCELRIANQRANGE